MLIPTRSRIQEEVKELVEGMRGKDYWRERDWELSGVTMGEVAIKDD